MLRDAAEEVIQILKDGNLRDPERHSQISLLLTGKPALTRGSQGGSGLPSEQYATFVQMGKQLDDYDDFTKKVSKSDGADDGAVDDDMGVAVVFDESDEDADGASHGGASDIEDGIVVDASSESDEEEVSNEDGVAEDGDDEEEKLIQGASNKKKSARVQDRVLTVHEIDAHFLQRQISRHFDDADVSAKLSNDVLAVLDIRNPTDVRECENKLLLLLGFELFETIKLLLHNRVKVWACVSMKRAQSDGERNEIEKALMEEPTGEGKRVWNEIHSRSRAEDWSRERLRGLTDTLRGGQDSKDVSKALDSITLKAKDRVGNRMDVDGGDKAKEKLLELDLESLAFRDGAQTMSNKQCNLPDTSWRAMRKGYEEVHVPAVRSTIPKDERLIPISELPNWTHPAFKGELLKS